MNTPKILFAALVAVLLPIASFAQVTDKSAATDSATIQLQLNQLNERKAQLNKQIAEEDRKRNQTIAGVTLENMEIMNLKQDSICLELRSQVIDLDLEIAERKAALKQLAMSSPTATAEATADNNQTSSAPQKPTPQKPNKIQQAIQAIQNKPNKK